MSGTNLYVCGTHDWECFGIACVHCSQGKAVHGDQTQYGTEKFLEGYTKGLLAREEILKWPDPSELKQMKVAGSDAEDHWFLGRVNGMEITRWEVLEALHRGGVEELKKLVGTWIN